MGEGDGVGVAVGVGLGVGIEALKLPTCIKEANVLSPNAPEANDESVVVNTSTLLT